MGGERKPVSPPLEVLGAEVCHLGFQGCGTSPTAHRCGVRAEMPVTQEELKEIDQVSMITATGTHVLYAVLLQQVGPVWGGTAVEIGCGNGVPPFFLVPFRNRDCHHAPSLPCQVTAAAARRAAAVMLPHPPLFLPWPAC